MSPWRRRLHDLSYSRKGLWVSCALIIAFGLVFAFFAGHGVRPAFPSYDPLAMPGEDFAESESCPAFSEADPLPYFEHILFHLEGVPVHAGDFDGQASPLDGLAVALWLNPSEETRRPLLALAEAEPVRPWVWLSLGIDSRIRGEYAEAGRYMEREHAARPDPILRDILLETYRRGKRYADIGRLERDPLFYAHMRGEYLLQVGIQQMHWPRILRHFWTAIYAGTKTELVAMALLAALVWGIVLHSLYGAPGALAPVARMGLALALGVVSTWPTLWTGFVFDDHWGMNAEGDFMHALIYFIASVGLREELCKLLLFTPFLPWILKRGGDLDALILGGMVGLGFAMEENVKYFDALFSGANVVSRLVSANVLHFSFTGVCALALTRLVRRPDRWMTDSLTLIAMAIGLHGLYNALLTREVPGVGDMSYFAGTAMAIGALTFFQEVGRLAALRGRWLSLTAIFFWGYCALFGLELMVVALALPFPTALSFIGQSALGGLYYAFVFLHGVREPLAD